MTEREIIERHFGTRKGRFLELGAHDGRTDSLTCGLVDAGWSGVQVEADPRIFLRLQENHGGNERLSLVQAAVCPKGGMMRFWSQQGGGQESTLAEYHTKRSGRPYERPHWVNALSVAGLLAAFGGPLGWQFLLIDVEGISGDTLAAFPLAEMTDTELICCERDTHGGVIERLLSPHYIPETVGSCNVFGRRRK